MFFRIKGLKVILLDLCDPDGLIGDPDGLKITIYLDVCFFCDFFTDRTMPKLHETTIFQRICLELFSQAS